MRLHVCKYIVYFCDVFWLNAKLILRFTNIYIQIYFDMHLKQQRQACTQKSPLTLQWAWASLFCCRLLHERGRGGICKVVQAGVGLGTCTQKSPLTLQWAWAPLFCCRLLHERGRGGIYKVVRSSNSYTWYRRAMAEEHGGGANSAVDLGSFIQHQESHSALTQ